MSWKIVKGKRYNKIVSSNNITLAIKREGETMKLTFLLDDDDIKSAYYLLRRAEKGLSLKKIY